MKIREQTVVLGIARDVTERKRAENAIRESEEKFRNIFEKAQDGLLLLGLDGNVADLNHMAAEIFHINKQSAIGKSLTELGFPTIAQIVQKNSDQTKPIQGGRSQLLETTIIRRDGETRHLEVTSSLVKRCNVRVGILSIVRDVTERKKMEERLVSSERMAAIGRLATMVAHDLRNPLQSIATATFCLKKSKLLEGNDRMLTVVRNIKESVDYSDKIVRDLLDYSKDIILDVSNNDPRSIISRTLSMITIPANVEVRDLTSTEPSICVDVDKIVRVCINLIANAFDAMPNRGTLAITSKKVDDNLLLSFADTGEGISKENLRKLWTPLFTTKAKGMGLGLPICKRIVDAHNGDILVESENGRGATFTIVLPITTSRKKNVDVYVREREAIPCKVNNGAI